MSIVRDCEPGSASGGSCVSTIFVADLVGKEIGVWDLALVSGVLEVCEDARLWIVRNWLLVFKFVLGLVKICHLVSTLVGCSVGTFAGTGDTFYSGVSSSPVMATLDDWSAS